MQCFHSILALVQALIELIAIFPLLFHLLIILVPPLSRKRGAAGLVLDAPPQLKAFII